MWRYFGIGKEKKCGYLYVIFLLKLNIILPYSATSKDETNKASMKSKKKHQQSCFVLK